MVFSCNLIRRSQDWFEQSGSGEISVDLLGMNGVTVKISSSRGEFSLSVWNILTCAIWMRNKESLWQLAPIMTLSCIRGQWSRYYCRKPLNGVQSGVCRSGCDEDWTSDKPNLLCYWLWIWRTEGERGRGGSQRFHTDMTERILKLTTTTRLADGDSGYIWLVNWKVDTHNQLIENKQERE